ncbi:hypothetical protein H5410_036481 [Solanum commersonii]|uniref:Uncharacterized protein n=1 Tax=Solanum commersonii TaxID=4109 RepID=A0A9J5Y4C6_SOLCO|nr:hypothetical protein H5410_036481 [Solanum commersonii]
MRRDGEMLLSHLPAPLGKALTTVDSRLLVGWIRHKVNPHWSINTQLEKLQALIDQTPRV